MKYLFQLLLGYLFSVSLASTSTYEIRPIPGKGFGCIALRDIHVGEVLIEERPIFSAGTSKSWFRSTDEYAMDRIDKLLKALDARQQSSFLSLHAFSRDRFVKSNLPPSSLDIFRTNAYPTEQNTAGIFPEISRLNSACIPNVHFAWDSKRKLATVHAIKNISKSEELENCYIGLFLALHERKTYFKKNFGFECQCRACMLSGQELLNSNERRQKLSDLKNYMQNTSIELISVQQFSVLIDNFRKRRLQLLVDEEIESPSTLLDNELDYIDALERHGIPLPLSNEDFLRIYIYAVQAKGQHSMQAARLRGYLIDTEGLI